MARMKRINPQRLEALRRQKDISQQALADKMNVNVGTVSRWERGAVAKLREDTFDRLSEILDTSEWDLSGNARLPEEPPRRESPPKQMNLVVDTACRNALALVAKRYGVTRQQIVEVAPLLFFIMAEQSLAERGERLKRAELARDEAETAILPHLRYWLRTPDEEDDRALLEAERNSIEARDLFAKNVGRWTERSAKDNPFAGYLTARLAETKAAEEVRVIWEEGEEPRYRICEKELADILGEDAEVREHIQKGRVALAEMPGHVRKSSAQEKARWCWKESQKELERFSTTIDEAVQTFAARGGSDEEF